MGHQCLAMSCHMRGEPHNMSASMLVSLLLPAQHMRGMKSLSTALGAHRTLHSAHLQS